MIRHDDADTSDYAKTIEHTRQRDDDAAAESAAQRAGRHPGHTGTADRGPDFVYDPPAKSIGGGEGNPHIEKGHR